jgi:hypothetical protein
MRKVCAVRHIFRCPPARAPDTPYAPRMVPLAGVVPGESGGWPQHAPPRWARTPEGLSLIAFKGAIIFVKGIIGFLCTVRALVPSCT